MGPSNRMREVKGGGKRGKGGGSFSVNNEGRKHGRGGVAGGVSSKRKRDKVCCISNTTNAVNKSV